LIFFFVVFLIYIKYVSHRYQPETRSAKKERLTAEASARASGGAKADAGGKKPVVVKYGLNHVTALVEAKKAQLVVIAADVDPIELVVWLPALCRKLKVPYCIVRSKALLGTVVHKKTSAVAALTAVRQEDKAELAKLVEACNASFLDRHDEARRRWGGGVMGVKSQMRQDAKDRAIEAEKMSRAQV
jgi:large subunit ribosomal protein L7Ae